MTCWHPVDAVRCTLLLLCFVTWCEDSKLVQQTYTLWNLLAHILTDIGLNETSHEVVTTTLTPASTWEAAMRKESTRRTKLSALSFLVTVSTTYDFPPSLRNARNHLRLPCSQSEWLARDATQWQMAKNEVRGQQLLYEQALASLLSHGGTGLPFKPVPTAFGTYLLIHGLLNRIAIVRELNSALYGLSSTLPVGDIEKLEYVPGHNRRLDVSIWLTCSRRALRAWTTVWQHTPESSVDPSTDTGRIPSTSSALLSLAYVRLHLNTGPYRNLATRDPQQIAKALQKCPPIKRGHGIISALLYATHALSIPVRLGLDRVARVQASLWTLRHTIAAFESAIVLSKWLSAVSESCAILPLSGKLVCH
jgi:hypothetical protein